jgi:uncharacterized repeat protein (TIGR03837 family)
MRWDIFCKVIDNHGDAGVCWRVSVELAARGHTVRLWMDDRSALRWMAPAGAPGVQVVPWTEDVPPLEPGEVVVEAFGCDPPPAFVARMAAAAAAPPVWLNLEYLSAEAYVERSHGLPSPVTQGPGAGLAKLFFYPGFTPRTGGLLREQDLPARRAGFDRSGWRAAHGLREGARVISLFCYEPAALPELLGQLTAAAQPTELLVTAGRAAAAVQAAGGQSAGALRLHPLPQLSQRDYDYLLWACDLNFVRGEDSLVRGLLAGVPCVWQIYPQDDEAHHAKLVAFLDWLQPPRDLRDFFLAWNSVRPNPLPPLDVRAWRPCARTAFDRAQALPELAAELERFAAGRGRI